MTCPLPGLLRTALCAATLGLGGCALADSVVPTVDHYLEWEGETVPLQLATCNFSAYVGGAHVFSVIAFHKGSSSDNLRFQLQQLGGFGPSGPAPGTYSLVPNLLTTEAGAALRYTVGSRFAITNHAQEGSLVLNSDGSTISVSFEGVQLRNTVTNVTSSASGRMTCE